jgi:hypothetical protein
MFGCYVLRWLVRSRREPRLTRNQMVAFVSFTRTSAPHRSAIQIIILLQFRNLPIETFHCDVPDVTNVTPK